MIVKGFVATDKGPVAIEKIKVGDMALDQMHRARKVISIDSRHVSDAYTFEKNPALIVTGDTVIKTVYGDKRVRDLKGKSTRIAFPDMRIVKDKVHKLEGDVLAYDIALEGGKSVFCSNYCVALEVQNA